MLNTKFANLVRDRIQLAVDNGEMTSAQAINALNIMTHTVPDHYSKQILLKAAEIAQYEMVQVLKNRVTRLVETHDRSRRLA